MFENLPFGDSLLISLLGMGIVFAVLVFLMLIIAAMSSIVRSMSRPKPVTNPVGPVIERERMTQAVTAGPAMVPAPGSMGEVALHSVDDTTAALLMAIVADDLACEPNQLNFISIREL